MSFAAAETRANASVIGRLANATAQVVGGGTLAIIFDSAYTAGLAGQIGGTLPQMLASDADVAANDVAADVQLTVRKTDAAGKILSEIDYVVREVQPDGTGLSVITMERA